MREYPDAKRHRIYESGSLSMSATYRDNFKGCSVLYSPSPVPSARLSPMGAGPRVRGFHHILQSAIVNFLFFRLPLH